MSPPETDVESKGLHGRPLAVVAALFAGAVAIAFGWAPFVRPRGFDLPADGSVRWVEATSDQRVLAIAVTLEGIALGLAHGPGLLVRGDEVVPARMPAGVRAFLPTPLGLWIGTTTQGLLFATGAAPPARWPMDRTPVSTVGALALAVERLWVGTDRGVYAFDGESWTFEGNPDPGGRSVVTALAWDESGTLWVGTSSGLYRRQGSVYEREALPGLANPPVTTLVPMPERGLFCGTASGMLVRSGGRWTPVAGGETSVHVAVQDGKDLWVGTADGLRRLEGGRLVPPLGFPSLAVTALAPAQDSLWVGTARGLFRYARRPAGKSGLAN